MERSSPSKWASFWLAIQITYKYSRCSFHSRQLKLLPSSFHLTTEITIWHGLLTASDTYEHRLWKNESMSQIRGKLYGLLQPLKSPPPAVVNCHASCVKTVTTVITRGFSAFKSTAVLDSIMWDKLYRCYFRTAPSRLIWFHDINHSWVLFSLEEICWFKAFLTWGSICPEVWMDYTALIKASDKSESLSQIAVGLLVYHFEALIRVSYDIFRGISGEICPGCSDLDFSCSFL